MVVRSSLILALGLLAACGGTPSTDPPVEGVTPSLVIVGPDAGTQVMVSPDADRSVAVSFTTQGITLKAPGSCLASDGNCGHVVVQVDGAECNVQGSAFNSIATDSPARAALVRCEVQAGSHTISLSIARDDRSPWMDDDEPIAASVGVDAILPPLLDRLGGQAGMQALASEMIERQLGTSSINAYFRNGGIDMERMELCMAAVFEQTADPAGTAIADAGCTDDMGAAHAGLGTSQADMDDWLVQFMAAGASTGMTAPDFAEFAALVGSHGPSIVEDPTNDATLYQRLGRRPGIWAVVQSFGVKLSMHAQVSRYFLGDDGIPEYSEVFAVCLTRLLGSLDGPFLYGEEVPYEPALAEEGRDCRGMVESHENMTSAAPANAPIGPDEFWEVAIILLASLEYHEVPQADIDALVGAMNLPGLCEAIIENPAECDQLFGTD